MGESPEPYKEGGIDGRLEELSVRTSQEKDEDKEDERLGLVLGELVKITNMLDLARGPFARMTSQTKC